MNLEHFILPVKSFLEKLTNRIIRSAIHRFCDKNNHLSGFILDFLTNSMNPDRPAYLGPHCLLFSLSFVAGFG